MAAIWRPLKGTPDNVIQLLLTELGYDFDPFARRPVYHQRTTRLELLPKSALPYTRAHVDIRDKGGKKLNGAEHEFGANYTAAVGITLTHVFNDSPAEAAGLAKGDNLIAINGYKIAEGKLQAMLDKLDGDSTAELSYFRRGRLHHTTLAIKAAEHDTIYLTIHDTERAALHGRVPRQVHECAKDIKMRFEPTQAHADNAMATRLLLAAGRWLADGVEARRRGQ